MVTNGPLAPLNIFSSSNTVETVSKDSLKHVDYDAIQFLLTQLSKSVSSGS